MKREEKQRRKSLIEKYYSNKVIPPGTTPVEVKRNGLGRVVEPQRPRRVPSVPRNPNDQDFMRRIAELARDIHIEDLRRRG